jgi:hypothetical protein
VVLPPPLMLRLKVLAAATGERPAHVAEDLLIAWIEGNRA